MKRLRDRIADENFTGRQAELHLLQGTLEDLHRPVPMIHLYGVGGVGKTELVRHFIARLQNWHRYVASAAFDLSSPIPADASRAALADLAAQLPSVGCPAKGSSTSVVKMRTE